jgi:metal-responsive CopG/Arc/MetJ family transcriptional regulator
MSITIKTAISIDKSLFEQAETLAQKLKVSRSRLFVLAVESYIKRYQSQALLDEINHAYADQHDPSEQKHIAAMRKSHRKLVEGEW